MESNARPRPADQLTPDTDTTHLSVIHTGHTGGGDYRSHLIITNILEALESELGVAVSKCCRRAIPPERLAINFDWIALSFVRTSKDITSIRELLNKKKSDIKIIAKSDLAQCPKRFAWQVV